MQYGVHYILVKSDWFDPVAKKNKMSQLGVDGLFIYLLLFKFKMFNFDKNANSFITSINLLSKIIPNRLKFSKDRIYECIRHLQRQKVIKVTNISNWNTQLVKEGKLDVDRVLMIEAIDYPQTKSENVNGKFIDKPVTKNDYYIAVNAQMIDEYLNRYNFDEKYICLLVLMQKYHRSMAGFYMGMERMEQVTGIDKNTINRMTWTLYKNKLLVAYRKKNNKGDYYHEYHICQRLDEEYYQKYLKIHGDEIDKWIRRLNRKGNDQKQIDDTVKVQNKINQSKVIVESQIKNEKWGYDDPFENVGNEHINNDYDMTDYINDFDDEFEKLFG